MKKQQRAVKKHTAHAGNILKKLSALLSHYSDLDTSVGKENSFDGSLEIIQKTMLFDASVLYKVTNVINNRLMLEVVRLLDPKGFRKDLAVKKRLRIFLDNPDPLYANEARAFMSKRVSSVNIPGMGCDITGYVYVPEEFGSSYLFGGDFFGNQSAVKDYEISAFEILCNFLSTILLKTQFEHQAIYDHLTGLLNSNRIRYEVKNVVMRSVRKHDAKACIAMADIDHFKKINDTYGHLQGDMVLKKVGEILQDSMRGYFDLAGRYGGEEFLLVFDDTPVETTISIIERMRKKIESTQFSKVDDSGQLSSEGFLNITVSFGIAELCSTSGTKDAEEWINQADKALYLSKKQGRNRTSVFDPGGEY